MMLGPHGKGLIKASRSRGELPPGAATARDQGEDGMFVEYSVAVLCIGRFPYQEAAIAFHV